MKTLQEKQIKSDNCSSVLRENIFPCNETRNLSGGEPVKMLTVWPPTHHNFKGNKNIIVNPLLSVQMDQQVSVPQQDLFCTVNKSSRPLNEEMFTVEDELSNIQSSKEATSASEPI